MKHLVLPLLALFCAVASATAQQGTLLLSELLFQPASGQAEYVELYNPGDEPVQLSGFHIVRVLHDSLSTHYPLPDFSVEPRSYVVLTTDAASVAACYSVAHLSRLLECALPPYPNASGSVVLGLPDSTVVERLDYSPSMHNRLLRDKAGVSLERRSFSVPASDASNWFSAASTAGYGTPTAPNSQSTELLAAATDFVFSSAIVSPDGDGYQDMLQVDYRMDAAGLSARAEVYDARGRLVRRLLNGDLLGSAGSLQWDGRAEGGAPLPDGQYIVQIVLYDTSGTHQRIQRTVAVLHN